MAPFTPSPIRAAARMTSGSGPHISAPRGRGEMTAPHPPSPAMIARSSAFILSRMRAPRPRPPHRPLVDEAAPAGLFFLLPDRGGRARPAPPPGPPLREVGGGGPGRPLRGRPPRRNASAYQRLADRGIHAERAEEPVA